MFDTVQTSARCRATLRLAHIGGLSCRPVVTAGSARPDPKGLHTMNPPGTTEPTPPWGAGPYSTLRHGTALTTCDSEPVHTPGCIQAHGALLVLRLGDLCILQASENCALHLGETAT